MARARNQSGAESGRASGGGKQSPREAPEKTRRGKAGSKPSPKGWEFRLYIAGDSPRSRNAVANLNRICEDFLPGECTVRVIDLRKNPELAQKDQIVAIPTLVKDFPEPVCVLIGDLSSLERVLAKLGFPSPDTSPGPEAPR